mgnify:CR=1 FL=1
MLLRLFSKTRKKSTFYCFARADEIDIERIEILKRLNVVAVFIGYESGSNEMLKAMHKFTTVEQNLQATRLLHEAGIEVFVRGWSSADQERLEKRSLRRLISLKSLSKSETTCLWWQHL